MVRLIALDTETTGFNPYRDRVIELALVELDQALQPIGQWVHRFNPGTPIPAKATAHHGICDQDAAGLAPFSAHAARIQRCLADATLIAYNGTRFDVPLLHCELRRAGQAGLPGVRVVDPLLEFRRQVPHTLTGALQHYCGKRHETPHIALNDVQAMVEVLRAQVRGDKPWSRKQLIQRLWSEADFLPGQRNVLGASIRARPFQGSSFECTIVVLYAVRRRHRLQPGELLHPNRNMVATILLTNRAPGSDTVAWAHATYAKRWSVEVDIREHKSYVNPGSGPKLFTRVLKEQVAMILENLATYLRAYRARHDARTFVRYVYNQLVEAHVVHDAIQGGWSLAIALAEAGPP